MAKLSALQLAVQLIHSVDYEMPIGAGNIENNKRRPSSKERTGEWAWFMTSIFRHGTLAWSKKHGSNKQNINKWEQTIRCPTSKERKLQPPAYVENFEKHVVTTVNNAIYATFFKSGFCEEISDLTLIKACQYAQKYLSPQDQFSFEIIELDGFSFMHHMVKITLNGESVFCDPWLHHACKIDEEGLDGLKIILENEGVLNTNNDDDLKDWNELKGMLLNKERSSSKMTYISSYEQADKLAKLYDSHYQLWIKNNISSNPPPTLK